MPIVDIILVLLVASFAIYGWKTGLIGAAGRIIGVFVGAFVAGQFYTVFASYFAPISFGSTTLQNGISFLVIFALVSQGVGLVFYIIDKLYNTIAIIPGLKAVNRLAGAVLGVLEGILFIAMVLYIAYMFPFSAWLDKYLATSTLASYFLAISKIISPFIPESLQALRKFIF